MKEDLNKLLDECIDRINCGESIEQCLTDYPEQAEKLEPLLSAMSQLREAYSPIPGQEARAKAKQRLAAASVESDRARHTRSGFAGLFGWARAGATVAVVLVLALIGFSLYSTLTPVAQANFRLLVSDQENAISDFNSLNVTITSIGVLQAGSGGWKEIELDPSVTVDLTQLQGLNAQEVWSGILPDGQARRVFIYIDKATGILKNRETVDVIVPSGNLQISKPFVVTTGDSVVNFVYDITVIAAGNDYVLLPQLDQSGPDQEFHEVGEGKLTLWVVDTALPMAPGQNISVIVKLEGDPLPGAQVKVNGVDVGNTSGEAGQEGRISFVVPYDEKLKVKAKINTALGELEGQLKIEFGDELTIKIVEGIVDSGQNVKVQVTFETLQGATLPIPGATVTVKDVGALTTDANGHTTFTIPYDDELKIKAIKDELKGELKIDLEKDSEEAELTIQVVEGEVTTGETITILVTFKENPVEDALVKVKDVGVFTTDGDGHTLPFTIPYDDELKIKAIKDELKGELKIDLEKDSEEAELTIQVVEGEVTAGETITILMTFKENPVEGALVKVKDVGVFTTDGDGRITFDVPAADKLEIKARLGELEGELKIRLDGNSDQDSEEETSEDGAKEGKLTLELQGEVTTGGNVTLLVTYHGAPVLEAQVTANDVDAGTTDENGRISFNVPTADKLEIEAKLGDLKGELERGLVGNSDQDSEENASEDESQEGELTLELQGEVTTGGNVTLLVTYHGAPVLEAQVTVNDVDADTTDENGRISFNVPTADKLEIKARLGELEGELKIDF